MGELDLAHLRAAVDPMRARGGEGHDLEVKLNGANRLGYLLSQQHYDFIARTIMRDGFTPMDHVSFGRRGTGKKRKGTPIVVVVIGGYRYTAYKTSYRKEKL
jgi:hypothetical protein